MPSRCWTPENENRFSKHNSSINRHTETFKMQHLRSLLRAPHHPCYYIPVSLLRNLPSTDPSKFILRCNTQSKAKAKALTCADRRGFLWAESTPPSPGPPPATDIPALLLQRLLRCRRLLPSPPACLLPRRPHIPPAPRICLVGPCRCWWLCCRAPFSVPRFLPVTGCAQPRSIVAFYSISNRLEVIWWCTSGDTWWRRFRCFCEGVSVPSLFATCSVETAVVVQVQQVQVHVVMILILVFEIVVCNVLLISYPTSIFHFPCEPTVGTSIDTAKFCRELSSLPPRGPLQSPPTRARPLAARPARSSRTCRKRHRRNCRCCRRPSPPPNACRR